MALHHSLEAKAFAHPQIRRFLKTSGVGDDRQNVCWSAKFWPYGQDHENPVFCLSNRWEMMVCRIRNTPDGSDVELLQHLETEQPEEELRDRKPGENTEEQYCSCAWAYLDEEEPLLLGAGDFGYIRVFDIIRGTLMTTLVGHGKGVINELATHPTYPWIFASASVDHSIRIWDLRRWNNKHQSPTIVICGAGNGHRESVLTVAWHDSGRYLISGAFDNTICVWSIPDLAPESSFWDEISPPQTERRADQVRIVHYPHFISSAIHNNYVDCVRFWGDIILSKAAEEHKIVLWQITGFNGLLPPPDTVLAPKASEHLDTRNGFTRALVSTDDGITKIVTKPAYALVLPYKRLLELANPACGPFFMRFDVLKQTPEHPDIHAVLACGHEQSGIRFWDLEALELGYDYTTSSSGRGGRRGRGQGSRKGIRGRLNQLGTYQRTESAAASIPSVNVTVTGTAPPSRTASPASTDSSSVPTMAAKSYSTDDTSLIYETPFPGDVGASFEPPEDRTRFPLKHHNIPLGKAHRTVDLFGINKTHQFVSRAAAWSPNGRWCVVAGETWEDVSVSGGSGDAPSASRGKGRGREKESRVLKIGAAVVLERDLR